MTTLTRPLSMTSSRQTLTFPANGYDANVTAYLWGAGGGAGGPDAARLGGAGSGGGYVRADFTVNPGDTIEITVGSAGSSGVNSSIANAQLTPIFNTRTAIPNTLGSTAPLPKASNTYVARWSAFLNQNGVWNTGTALNGSVTSLANTLTFDQSYTVWFQYSINYVFTLAAYYQATVYLDGAVLIESGLNSWITQNSAGEQFVRTITPGQHVIRIVATANPGATYGTFGVALTIAAATNAGLGGGGLIRNIFDTRSTAATANPPLYTPVAPAAASFQTYSNLIVDFGVWEQDIKAPSCSRTYNNVYFPYTGVYQVEMAAANTATLSIDGAVVFTTPGTDSYSTSYTTDVTVSQGYHTLSFVASFSQTSLPAAGIAIVISKSWSGATGGLAGPEGTSGGGGGSGGCTTLIINPKTPNEKLLAVAVGGAGGGGAGNSNTGIGEATAPGPRGQTAAGISNGQAGQNQGDLYKDGGGGGGGGGGGPAGAGKNGYSSEGDAYGQAGSLGISYRNTAETTGGQVIEPTGRLSGGRNSEYYSLVGGTAGNGAAPGQFLADHGAAVLVVDAYGIQVRDDAIDSNWHDVKTAFVNVNGVWRQTFAAFIWQNNAWQMVIGGAALTFTGQTDDFGRVSRPADRRALPPPPPKVYDSVRQVGCFIAGTLITMADGFSKNIEDVVVGDRVVGKDGSINTVQELIRPKLGDRKLIGFNGGTCFLTNDHPVWVENKQWCSFDPELSQARYSIAVNKYQIGDILSGPDQTSTVITSIEEHADSADLQVYNFSLDGNNTYIANNIVVHNKGRTGLNGTTSASGTGSTGSSAGNGSGASTAGGSSPGSAYSDARLKRNIKLISTRWDGLKIYTYNYVWSDVKWVGVIAQDLLQQEQFASSVTLESNGFYSVDYNKINFKMIMANQYRCLHRET